MTQKIGLDFLVYRPRAINLGLRLNSSSESWPHPMYGPYTGSTVVPGTSCTCAMHDITRKRICALLEKKKKNVFMSWVELTHHDHGIVGGSSN